MKFIEELLAGSLDREIMVSRVPLRAVFVRLSANTHVCVLCS